MSIIAVSMITNRSPASIAENRVYGPRAAESSIGSEPVKTILLSGISLSGMTISDVFIV